MSRVTFIAIAVIVIALGLAGWRHHYVVGQVETLTASLAAETSRANANAEALAKTEADRKVAVATLEFLQNGLVENEKQARIAAEETVAITASDDAPAAAFWEKSRQRMLSSGGAK